VKVILVRPAYDDVSRAMSAWAEEAKTHIDHEHDLEGPSANEVDLRGTLQAHPNASLVAFYGHGEPDSLLTKASDGTERPLIRVTPPGVQPQELQRRHLYAVACKSAAQLGPALAVAGCSFVGYEGKFTFPPAFEKEFGDVVNRCLCSWATGEKGSAVIGQELKEGWFTLSDALSSDAGRRKDLWLGAYTAFLNGRRVRAL
jgi:hypothetical protein